MTANRLAVAMKDIREATSFQQRKAGQAVNDRFPHLLGPSLNTRAAILVLGVTCSPKLVNDLVRVGPYPKRRGEMSDAENRWNPLGMVELLAPILRDYFKKECTIPAEINEWLNAHGITPKPLSGYDALEKIIDEKRARVGPGHRLHPLSPRTPTPVPPS